MKALVYQGSGQKAWEEVPDAKIIDPTDIVIKVETTTICGTDLHILQGDVPAVTEGRVLGHEAVGSIVEVGSAVTTLKVGDRIIVPAVTSCGACSYCKAQMPSHCQAVGGIGWILGHLIDGTQAEYVRVPFAQTSVHKIPDGMLAEQMVFISDIYPTGFEIGVQDGNVRAGDNVVVIGAGPVGLAAMATAQLHGPAKVIAVDLSEDRLAKAVASFGATHAVNSSKAGWVDDVIALTDGLGVNVAIEAVGVPATLEAAYKLIRPGGRVANIGVHGKPVSLPIDDLWIHNFTLTAGLVNTTTIPVLLSMIQQGRLDIAPMGTHHFKLDNMMEAYDVFVNAAAHGALKVMISA